MGQYIRFLREKTELSQAELGAMLKPPVQRQAVNKWESGRIENIKRTHIEQMARIFHMSPAKLMCFEEPSIEADETETYGIVTRTFGIQAAKLLEIYTKLNENGKNKVLEDIDNISQLSKYTEDEKKDNSNLA